jgi:hypothetical protein
VARQKTPLPQSKHHQATPAKAGHGRPRQRHRLRMRYGPNQERWLLLPTGGAARAAHGGAGGERASRPRDHVRTSRAGDGRHARRYPQPDSAVGVVLHGRRPMSAAWRGRREPRPVPGHRSLAGLRANPRSQPSQSGQADRLKPGLPDGGEARLGALIVGRRLRPRLRP